MIVSEHGINATLGGTVEDLKQYVKTTRRYPGFEGVDVKWSDGTGRDFPRLSVKVRPELVAFGVPDEVRVDEHGVVGGGERLSPQALHDLVEERGDDVVMLDGRNAFEAAIGRFRGAVVPDVATTRDFVAEIDSGRYDDLKGRPVVTYCTGACGARCCRAAARPRVRGGLPARRRRRALWRGVRLAGTVGGVALRVRRAHARRARPGSTPLGACTACGAPTAKYENCADPSCRTLRLYCSGCVHEARSTRCETCVRERPAALTGGLPRG